MGLYINHLRTVTFETDRSLYIYLLDYGWPEGDWEKIFKRHFMKMADLASDTNAAVIGSPQGIHFANEVLSWHKVGDLDAEKVLPGLLITKSPPHHFNEALSNSSAWITPTNDDMLVIALKPFCKDDDDFVKAIESVFSDLTSDAVLHDYQIAKHDILRSPKQSVVSRMGDAIELKPGAFGFKLDIKALLSRRN